MHGTLTKTVSPSMLSILRLLCLPLMVMMNVSCSSSVGNVGSPLDSPHETQNVERDELRALLEFIHQEQNSEGEAAILADHSHCSQGTQFAKRKVRCGPGGDVRDTDLVPD